MVLSCSDPGDVALTAPAGPLPPQPLCQHGPAATHVDERRPGETTRELLVRYRCCRVKAWPPLV